VLTLTTAAQVEGEKPSGPRSRKGIQTRSRLVEAAKAVFEKDGFLEARISDIAERAGLSHGSFYHYFDSKEQIFREVAKAIEDELEAPVDAVIFDPESTATPRERIREGIRRHLMSYRNEAAIMGIIEQVSRYDDHVNDVRMKRMHFFADRSERAVRQWQSEGIADSAIDPVVAADALGAMIARFAEMWLVQGYREYDFDHAVEQLTRLWCNALGLPDASTPPRRVRKRT
jgi:AcrR family transcriptional regulator